MVEKNITDNLEIFCDFIGCVTMLVGIDFFLCLIFSFFWRFVFLFRLVCKTLLYQLGFRYHDVMDKSLTEPTNSLSTSSKSKLNHITNASFSIYKKSTVKSKAKRFFKMFWACKVLASIIFALIPRSEIKEIIISDDLSTLYDNGTGYFKLIDQSKGRFIQKPNNRCTDTVRFILMILSSPNNAAQRDHLRRNYSQIDDIFMLFLIGMPGSKEIQIKLESENLVHGDLLQGSLYDSYKTIAYKTLTGFMWTSLNCAHTKYIVKMDDNVNVDLDRLTGTMDWKYGKNTSYNDNPPDIIECPAPVRNLRPWRHNHTNTILGKWSVTLQEMPRWIYPDFCFGWVYVTTPKVGLQLVEAAVYDDENVNIAWRDDQYITGFLREKLPHVKLQQINSGWTDVLPCPFIGITTNVFFNEIVLEKSSGQVAYVGGIKFYACIFFEFFILEKLEKRFSFTIPDVIWDACSR